MKDVNSGDTQTLKCAAAFVAIGHSPNTGFVKDIVDMDNNGYVVVKPPSTYTTVDGVFAAGDVASWILFLEINIKQLNVVNVISCTLCLFFLLPGSFILGR